MENGTLRFGRVPFPSIVKVYSGRTPWGINWRWKTAFPCVLWHFNHCQKHSGDYAPSLAVSVINLRPYIWKERSVQIFEKTRATSEMTVRNVVYCVMKVASIKSFNSCNSDCTINTRVVFPMLVRFSGNRKAESHRLRPPRRLWESWPLVQKHISSLHSATSFAEDKQVIK